MFDELIIAEIQKRRQQQEVDERPFLELPIPEYEEVESKEEEKPEPKRVIIIDLL